MYAILKESKTPGAIYKEIDVPVPAKHEVLIEVKAAAICGTDIHLYHWDSSAISFTEKLQVGFPLTLGHEVSGIIVKLGSEVTDRNVGDRVSIETHIPCGQCFQCLIGNTHNCMNMGLYGVTYNGAFANYAMAPSSMTYVLPDNVSFEEGALFEPAGVAVRAVGEARIRPGDTVVVYGCGPIGLIAAQMAHICAAGHVIAIDINPYRLNMAKNAGLTVIDAREEHVAEKVLEWTKARGGADAVLELTGSREVYPSLFDLIRREGRLVTVGHPAGEVAVNVTRDINQKGLSLKGIFGRKIWSTWLELATLVKERRLDLLQVVTHRFPFSEYETAFSTVIGDAGKVLLIPDKTD